MDTPHTRLADLGVQIRHERRFPMNPKLANDHKATPCETAAIRLRKGDWGEDALRRLERITLPAVLVSDIVRSRNSLPRSTSYGPRQAYCWSAPMPGPLGDADEFLAKPYSTDRFLGRVERRVRHAYDLRLGSEGPDRSVCPGFKPPAGAVRVLF